MSTTHIASAHKAFFEDLTSGTYGNVALFSCFVDGAPAVAIVCIQPLGDDGSIQITPLFVSVTDQMVLTDHDGIVA